MTDHLESLDDAVDVWERWALEPEELAAIVRSRRALRELRGQADADQRARDEEMAA